MGGCCRTSQEEYRVADKGDILTPSGNNGSEGFTPSKPLLNSMKYTPGGYD